MPHVLVLLINFLFPVTIESTAKKVIFLIFYHVLFVMFFWSYFQTIFIDVGHVPDKVSQLSNFNHYHNLYVHTFL